MSVERPPVLCSKCGAVYGFLYSKPEYHEPSTTEVIGSGWEYGHSTGEHLDFRCSECGYRVERLTVDNEVGA